MPVVPAAKPGGRAQSQVVQWIVSALPAIAGGISFVGLVAVLGAAITWVRFAAAQLPADQAISKIPKSDLVGIGAVSLVAFMILGLLAVLTVYLLQRRPFGDVADKVRDLEDDLASARRRAASIESDLKALSNAPGPAAPTGALEHERAHAYDEISVLQGRLLECEGPTYRKSCPRPTLATQQGLVAVVAAEIVVAIFVTDTELDRKFALAALVVIPAFATIAFQRVRESGTPIPPELTKWLSFIKLALPLVVVILIGLLLNHVVLYAGVAAVLLGAAILAFGPPWLRGLFSGGILSRVPVELIQLLLAVASLALIGALVDMVVLYAGAAAVLLAGAALAIASIQPRRFFWYGFAIFASVALFGAILEGIRTVRDPSVQPVGVVMKDGRGINGLYVTETSDRLWLARVDQKEKDKPENGMTTPEKDATAPLHSDGRLFWVPRSDVKVYSVGPLQHIDRANDRAPQLVDELQNGISPGVSGAP